MMDAKNPNLNLENIDSKLSSDMEQYLTFYLDNEEYGLNILHVMEIRGWEKPTPLPSTPSHIHGVINMRGLIVPIIDLRDRFELASVEYSALTVIIVLQVEDEGKTKTIGITVDAVSDVYTLNKQDLQAPPESGSAISKSFIKGLVNVNEKMVIILDGEWFLNLNEITEIGNGEEPEANG